MSRVFRHWNLRNSVSDKEVLMEENSNNQNVEKKILSYIKFPKSMSSPESYVEICHKSPMKFVVMENPNFEHII